MNNNIENRNIWETNYKNNCIFFTTFEELITFIEQNNESLSFILHEKQYPNQNQKCYLDALTNQLNISITYTNSERPITILKEYFNQILINPDFFEQHKDKFIEYSKTKLIESIKTKPFFLSIPDYLISDELIDLLISSKDLLENTTISFSNITNQTLNNEQIKKLKQAYLDVTINRKKISSKYVIKHYSIKDIQNKNILTLKDDLSEEEINNFIHINPNATIKIRPSQEKKDELTFFANLIKIFETLNKHEKTYNISIDVENRELLKQSKLLNYTKNINLTITNDLYDYSKKEYQAEEVQLDELINHIKNSTLSPYEKYLAVYNIVKQFKPYQENQEDKEKARNIRYILNNEYIVCVGYSKLLKILLDKVGIPCHTVMGIGIDISYDNGFTMEEKPTEIEKHARNIIKINDPKYGINGVFIADATWDNDMENDLYHNASMTFDRKKEAFRLEQLAPHDLLLDFHNQAEFIRKINFYLKRKVNSSKEKTYADKLIMSYLNIYQEIMNILHSLDYNKYSELYDKYESLINKSNTKLRELESICIDFLTEYATYIIPLSNKKINEETLFTAATIARESTKKHSEEEITEIKQQIKSTHQEKNNRQFPYVYDPNETREGYLSDATESRKKR